MVCRQITRRLLLTVAALLLAGCQFPQFPSFPPQPTQSPAPTQEPVPTDRPVPPPPPEPTVSPTPTLTPIPPMPPEAKNFSISTDEDVPVDGLLVATDPDSAPSELTFSIVNRPTRGTVTLINAKKGTFRYSPNADLYGTDSFTYRVSDGHLVSQDAQVAIQVRPVNDAPEAQSYSITLDLNNPLSLSLSARDRELSLCTFRIISPPTSGKLTSFNPSTGRFVYTPSADFVGNVSFSFKANDGQLDSPEGTVTFLDDRSAGILDARYFNVSGVARGAFGNRTVKLSALSVLADDKIFAAGQDPAQFGWVMFDPTGRNIPGTTVSVPKPAGNSDVIIANNDQNEILVGMQLYQSSQPNGFVLTAYRPNGQVDTSFASQGSFRYTKTGVKLGAIVRSTTAERSTVIAFSSPLRQNGTVSDVTSLMRFSRTGALDTSFGTNGYAYAGQGTVEKIYVNADRSIVVAGNRENVGVVTRMSASGQPLSQAVTPLYVKVHAVAVHSDGTIYLSGVENVIREAVLLKFTSQGALDTRFGNRGDGLAIVEITPAFGSAVAVQPNGMILVQTDSGTLKRFYPSGDSDTTLGHTGAQPSSLQNLTSVVLQRDGKILVGGSRLYELGVARYWPGP